VLSPESKWDGTYNGEALPVSDYWFYVTIEDKEGNSKIYKGNFSIVR
jgi:gliding motility-associated-like protein